MASDSALPGKQKAIRIGKYEVIAHIATGGMGAVYRARDPEGRDIALKVLTPEMAAKPAMLERFRREARHAAKLQHENIVRVYEFDEYKGTYYIAMEFVDGVDLLEHIDRAGKLDPEETRQIMIQATRALKHAEEHAIVHRDVKPANFLVTKKNGRLLVKLTDLGLAREASNEEFRVTKAGTTVGTVDYMSPEQARASGSADIRSDLYSLGCTWFHMLAGQPPFAAGTLTERIIKHIQEEPRDVREFSPHASKALVNTLNKLLEKEPVDRYQTPGELLHELLSLTAIASSSTRETPPPQRAVTHIDGLTTAEGEKHSEGRRKSKKTRSTKGQPQASGRRLWLLVGGATLGTLLLGLVVLLVVLNWPRGTRVTLLPVDPNLVEPVVRENPTVISTAFVGPLLSERGPVILPPAVDKLPPLLIPASPLNVAALRQRIDAAFPKGEPPVGAAKVRIKRLGENDTTFANLTDALAKTTEAALTIEIHDNGPLYWSMAACKGRSVTLRAAAGFRPLIVWDLEKTARERKTSPVKTELAKPLTFLSVANGSLQLENLDIVLPWPDKLTEPLTLVQANDAEFSARNCTFSASGKYNQAIAVVRFTSRPTELRHCRLSACVVRGLSLQALDLDAPGSQVLLENCLMAGGDFPLLQARSGDDRPATIHVIRSTLVASTTLLELLDAPMEDAGPSLNWLSWDSLLSRSSETAGGELIALPPRGKPDRIKWEAVNTLYAGWQTRLGGAEPIRLDDEGLWKNTLRREGDRAIPHQWPPPQTALAEVAADVFQTLKTPVGFASSVNADEPLGCALNQLPPLRDNWKTLTYERFVVAPSVHLENSAALALPLEGERFNGQVLDLSSTFDLGLFLQEKQQTPGLASKVVLHLRGTDLQKMTPIKLKGVHLTLYFEQPAEEGKRLSLTLPTYKRGMPLPAALLEIENGGLDIINGEFLLPDLVSKAVTATLFKVSGGDLRLYRCRLFGPHMFGSPDNYRALIQFDGSGAVDAARAHQCLINESVLVSENTILDLHGVGSRLLVKQSALIAGGAALHIDLGNRFQGRANLQGVFTNCSVASRYTLVQIEDAASAEPVLEPIVIQSSHCAFESPFKDAKVSLLRFGGDALTHGLFLWQSDGDLFDSRLVHGCLPASAEAPKPGADWQTTWQNLFGSYALIGRKNEPLQRQFELQKGWLLEQLLLTPPTKFPADGMKPLCGADLMGNGFVKKPKRP